MWTLLQDEKIIETSENCRRWYGVWFSYIWKDRAGGEAWIRYIHAHVDLNLNLRTVPLPWAGN